MVCCCKIFLFNCYRVCCNFFIKRDAKVFPEPETSNIVIIPHEFNISTIPQSLNNLDVTKDASVDLDKDNEENENKEVCVKSFSFQLKLEKVSIDNSPLSAPVVSDNLSVNLTTPVLGSLEKL